MSRIVDDFDPFGGEEDDNVAFASDTIQWSSDGWGNAADATAIDSTFDSTTLFDFSSTPGPDPFFPGPQVNPKKSNPVVHISIKEQLVCLYDEFSNTSSGRVDGSIFVQTGSNDISTNGFCLVIRDPRGHVEDFKEDGKVCQNALTGTTVTPPIFSSLSPQDRVLRISSPDSAHNAPIATYVCGSSLRPIPLLVKTKVQVSKQHCNVGIRARANPTNEIPLTKMAILLAVPPDINGETVKILKHDGVWDGMKRVIAWSVKKLEPGEIIEMQCRFEFVVLPSEEDTKRPSPKFPVLVRCDAENEQLSDIEVSTDYVDEFATSVKMELSRCVRILHRKV